MTNALDDRSRKEQDEASKRGLEIKEEEKKSKRNWGKTAESAGSGIKRALEKL